MIARNPQNHQKTRNTPGHSFKPPLGINIIYSHPMVYTFSLTKFVAFLPENAMLTGTGITCPFKHGQSSSERCSVMILDPVVGNLWKARDSQKRKHHMSSKLFVGNLSFKTTENELQDAFAEHGTVLETNLMMDRATGRPRGFGFVTMSLHWKKPKSCHRSLARQRPRRSPADRQHRQAARRTPGRRQRQWWSS